MWNMKETAVPIVVGTVTKRLGRNTGGIENQKKNRDYFDHSIVKIG